MTRTIRTITIFFLIVAMMTASLLFFAPKSGAEAAEAKDGKIKTSYVLNNGKADVTVRLEQNCGINAMQLVLTYDEDLLTLTGVDKGDALSTLRYTTTNTSTEKGYSITPFNFIYNGTSNDSSTGVLFTLHFSVKKGADAESAKVDLRYNTITSVTASGDTERKSFSITQTKIALKSSGPKVGLIVGIVVGCLAIGIVIGVVLFKKRKK